MSELLSEGNAKKILLIEDSAAFAQALLETMNEPQRGLFELSWSPSLTEALEALRKGDFEAALLDLHLPESSSPRETLRAVRGNFPALPIVILSSLDNEELVLQLLREGAHEYVVKSSVTRELIAAVLRSAIERNALRMEQRQADEALRLTASRLQAAVQASNTGLWDWDLRTNKVHFSREWKKQIGYADSEISDDFMEWQSRVHPEDLDPCLTKVQSFLKQPWPNFESEFRFRHKDGSYRWILARGAIVDGADGKPARMLGSHLDITDRKQAEQASREAAERYRSLFENMMEGYAHCRMLFENGSPVDFVYLGVNSAFEKLTGLHGVLGRKVTEVIPGIRESNPEAFEILGRVSAGDNPVRFETYAAAVDKWLTIAVHCPKLGEFVAVFDDITDRKRAQEQIRKLSRAVEQSPASILVTNTKGEIDYVNRKFTEVTGYTFQEMRGQNPRLLKSGEMSEEEYAQLWKTITSGGEWRGEFHNKKKNGELFWELASISPITDDSGAITHFVAVKEDITGSKEVQEALRQSEQRFRAIFDGAEIGMCLSTPANEILLLNTAYQKMLGVTEAEMRDLISFDDLTHPEDRKRDWDKYMALLAGEFDYFQHEKRYLLRDGSVVWANLTIHLLRDAQGQPQFVLGMAVDITAQKRAALAVEASEAKYRTLTESASAAIFICRESKFYEVNRAFESITGFSREEIIGKDFWAFVHPDHREMVRERGLSRLRGESVLARYEFKACTKSGRECWVEFTGATLDFAGAKALVGTAVDITERKLAAETLSHSEAQYRGLVEHATYGILRAEANGRLLDANPAFVEMLGYSSKEEMQGLDLSRDIWCDVEQRQKLIATVEHTPVRRMQADFKHKDGNVIKVQLSSRMVGVGSNGHTQIETIVDDVTERLLLEQQLRQAQKMEAVGRLAGGIAHDFNNLLGIVLGYADLLKDSLENEQGRGYIEEVRKAAERATSLTRQLLAFSRKQVMAPKIIGLNMIVSDMQKMIGQLIGEDIKLVTRLDPELGPVKADPGQIEQVIMNLVVNARDAMSSGGSLTLETANALLDEEYASKHETVKPGHYVMLAVSDTGVGMDPKTQAHIFEPFFTTKKEGTGLGLATTYGIVKQSGGYIWVYSEQGRGTTFKVYLPRLEGEADLASEPVKAIAATGGKETILLAEDAEALRTLTRVVLERYGYRVLEARDGHEALRLAEQSKEPIDLLVTDVVMPEVSGDALAARVRAMHPETKILYVSGYTDSAIAQHGVLQEDVELLSKPFTGEALALRVRKILDSQPRLD